VTAPRPHAFALPLRTAALLGVGTLLGVVVNLVRPAGIHADRFEPEVSCAASGAHSPITQLAPAEAARLCGDPGVLIADVRAADRFAEGHVVGAIHLPCAAPDDVLGRALAASVGKQILVVYGDSTADAQAVAASLRDKLPRQDLQISVLTGGFAAWDAAGLACSSGPCPECGLHARNRSEAGEAGR
jgi:rhodanese-related sulfurtransferase